MSGNKKKNLYVVKSKAQAGKFVVKEAGNPIPLTPPTTQAKAIERAVPLARANRSEVVIQGRDGKFRDSDSYGNDPYPPRDKKH